MGALLSRGVTVKKKVLKVLSYILVAALASAATLFICVGMETKQPSKLDALENLIEERFIGEADATQMEDAAAKAMVDALGDRWSYYIPASQYQAHVEQMNNAYVGIGITIQAAEDDSGFEVVKVEPDGPADEAGVLAGDVITAIEGQSAAGMSTSDARDLVRGEEGTQVKLTLRRGEETFDLPVTRKTVQTAVATARMLDGGIGLVTIANFDSRCAEETIAAVKSLMEQGAQALLFDVRYNPGGYKDELVKVLDYLLPEGPLFRSEDYLGRVTVDQSDADCVGLPMAVLVNGSSYSAAEFFAAALQEYDWATVVGTKTCGKGNFQTAFTLSDGSMLNLSIGKYFTPNGRSLTDIGVTPDEPVELSDEDAAKLLYGQLAHADDAQLQAAIRAIRQKIS